MPGPFPPAGTVAADLSANCSSRLEHRFQGGGAAVTRVTVGRGGTLTRQAAVLSAARLSRASRAKDTWRSSPAATASPPVGCAAGRDGRAGRPPG